MRIALQNSLPNHPEIAEAEWSKRFLIAADRVGFDVVEVVTSDDILACRPDCVLVTHEYSPKLTEFPTIGLNWSPPAFFADDPIRRRALLSLDGHLCGSASVAEWIDDFCAGQGKRAVIHDRLMLPSTHDCGPAGAYPAQPAVMYAGTHWDGSRHGAVFSGLDGRVPLHIYGPSAAWHDRGESYRGLLPFDGTSVIDALRQAGIALCLHKAMHRDADTPSMRLFEAAAAGALIITDDFGFPRHWFRDSALYVDASLPAPLLVEQIVAHVDWAARHRDVATRLARQSNAIFRESFTLEGMLRPLPDFVDRVRERRLMVPVRRAEAPQAPTVEYVIRVGSRPTAMITRALESLAAQTHPSIAITIVQFHPVEGLDDLLAQYSDRFAWINRVIVPNLGNRATCWWAGLHAVRADYLAFLDDDDTLFPNHVALLLEALERHPESGFAYCGLIRIEEEEGHYVDGPQFNGPRGETIPEQRELFAIEEERFVDFSPTRNVIGHNAWICRRSVLDEDMLRDPAIDWAEDVFFLTLAAGRTPFRFVPGATATWHWRSTSKDNWTLSHPSGKFRHNYARWRRRLQATRIPAYSRIAPPAQEMQVDEMHARDIG